jgi:hypothetical protein
LRVPGRKAVTIKGRYGSSEFAENYRAALAPVEKKGLGVPRQGSIASLARAYIASAHFASLASETRDTSAARNRDLRQEFGDDPVRGLEAKHVQNHRRISRPCAHLVGGISALMVYAVDMGWR